MPPDAPVAVLRLDTKLQHGNDRTAPASRAIEIPPGMDRLRDEALRAAARRRRFMLAMMPWLVFGCLILLWEMSVHAFRIPQFVLPAPSVIFDSMVTWWDTIQMNALQTLQTTVVGFALANVLGLALGVSIGSSVLVYRGVYPLLIAFNSIPKVAVVPVLVIWFGIGTVPAIITSFLISLFPITVNVAAGIATVEPELRDVLRALGAPARKIVLKVGLPRSMPFYFASLKIAITSSFLGSIIAETVAGQKGIGHLMILASSRFDVPLVFAGLIVTAMMSVTMYTLATVIERRTTAWATRDQNSLGATSAN